MICQRPSHKARGLLWEFVGGKVEKGETHEAALVRECREELDITIAVDRKFMSVTHTYPDLTVHLTLFHASIKEGEPKLLEHANLAWITPDEIFKYDFCPADKEILEEIIRTKDLSHAIRTLHAENDTCVLCKDGIIYTSTARGVKPLVEWYESDMSFRDFSAADKVVGRGAAFLYVLLGIRSLYAGVISCSAYGLLLQNGIETTYTTLVPNIINRAGDGICPFEEAVLYITDPDSAYQAIRKKMQEMHIAR